MGCNCGGSLKRAVSTTKSRREARESAAQANAPKREGQKGTTWDGPRRRTPPAAPASE